MSRQVVFVVGFALMGCAEKWNVEATAREQCALAEMEMRKVARSKLDESIAWRNRILAVKDHDPLLLKLARERVDKDIAWTNMPKDKFLESCRVIATERLAPCAKDFRPSTPAAAACVQEKTGPGELLPF